MEACEIPNVDWKRLPKGVEENFTVLMKEYFKPKLLALMQETGTLGYALKSEKTSEYHTFMSLVQSLLTPSSHGANTDL